MKFRKIKFQAEAYSRKRMFQKGETFIMAHQKDFIAGYKQALKDNLVHEVFGAIQEFCDRVEKGEVHSKSTYARFKNILKSSLITKN